MKKMRFLGVWTVVVLAAGLLALAGCDDTVPSPGGTETGAAIERFAPAFDGITSSEFSIAASTAAVVSTSPVNTGQTPEYGVSTTTTPPATWRNSMTFSGLQDDTTYYVFARAAAKTTDGVSYTAGAAFRAQETVTTLAEEDITSVTNWDPNPVYNDVGTHFTITGATPASPYPSNHPIEYALNTNSTYSPTSTFTWQDSRQFPLTRVSSSSQYYLWARAKATADDPAGVPRSKVLELHGARLSGEWHASYSGETNTSAIVTVNADFTKFPSNDQEIEYGLGTSASSAPGSPWGVPNSSGSYTFTGLTANTDYHLWARTKAVTNYLTGDAIKFGGSSNTPFLHTLGNAGSAGDLLRRLNAMAPESASSSGAEVTLMKSVDLSGPIDIPEGVTLRVPGNITLDNKGFMIQGGGAIVVVGTSTTTGSIKCDDNVTVAIHLDQNASFDNGQLTISKSSSILSLASGEITVKHGGSRNEYTLNGSLTINNNKPFRLEAMDTFTIAENGASLNATTGTLDLAGKIVVQAGGLLLLPSSNTFDVLKNNTAGIVTNPGAMVHIGTISAPPPPSGHIFYTVTPAATGVFFLQPGSQAEISKDRDTDKPKLTITNGNARINNSPPPTILDVLTYEVQSSATLTVPMTQSFTVTGGLTVIGTLTLEEPQSTTISGGSLTVSGAAAAKAAFNVRGTVNVNKGATLTLGSGVVALKGGGTINVKGTMQTPEKLAEFCDPTGRPTESFTGKVDIREGGVLTVVNGSTTSYIGFAPVSGTSPRFLLSGGSPRIEISTVSVTKGIYTERHPQFTLTGGYDARAELTAATEFYGRFVIDGGTLDLKGFTLTLKSNILALQNNGTLTSTVGTGILATDSTNTETSVAGSPPTGAVTVQPPIVNN